ncbi:hypothetical protein [Gluconacetobacter takamatsuzukensis]|uniref:Uncharacterized protein n=2 Tax=Acetobacteraceae TaxID=433 RepID=A0A7W4KGF9_9PROT|nr:hypothetical protein [Gluconacetobacter takamatsuzukensis]MBB2206448.1 hypothetical protein [Gluconacetobacter takamatsuzukensis]
MTQHMQRPVPGTDAYWRDRWEAFAQIRKLEGMIAWRDRQPHWCIIGYVDGEPDIDANVEPWNRVHDYQQALAANPTIAEILGAQGRLALLTA